MNVVSGSDVTILFRKGDDFFPFVCATDMELNTTIETVETRTIGDGKWRKIRARKGSYTITISGVITHIGTDVNSFYLQDAMLQMGFIEYRAIWDDPVSNLRRVVSGKVVITSSSLPSAADGFATSNFTLDGDGPYTITDSTVTCTATIGNVTVGAADGAPGSIMVNYSGASNNTERIDYEIDGNGRDTVLVGGAPSGFIFPTGNYSGTHTIILYPICENGEDGISFERTFTI